MRRDGGDDLEANGPGAFAPRAEQISRSTTRRAGCPKSMVYGPCGGVRSGGRCEVDDRLCPFVTDRAPRWTAARVQPDAEDALPRPPGGAAIVVCDFRPSTPTLAAARSLARQHAGWCDALLLGEHHDRVDLPNPTMAAAVIAEGCRPWVTFSCRDRNSVALEADLVACRELGVRVVHCVTGDARAPHVRPGTAAVFDLDSMRLTALARSLGLTVSVAETPAAEPIDLRPERAADKWRAGATWCFVNVGVGPEALDRFIRESRAAGSRLRYIACVPIFTDATGAERLARLPGVELQPAAVDAVLRSSDPRAAGVQHAVETARTFLAVDGVEGVDLSGSAAAEDPLRADIMRAVAERLR